MSIESTIEGAAVGAIPGVSQVRAILAGIMVVGLIGLALWVWRIDGLRAKHLAEAQALNIALHQQEQSTAASNTSLGKCNAQLAIKSGESDKRHDDYVAAQAAQQAADAKNDRLQQTVEAQHAALLAMSKVPGGSCQVPPALIGNLGGL